MTIVKRFYKNSFFWALHCEPKTKGDFMKNQYSTEEKITFFEEKLRELNIEIAYKAMILDKKKNFLKKKIQELKAEKTGTKES